VSDEPAESPAAVARRVHEHLRATEELPVDREASRWIGEAQAVAGDAADGGLADEVVRERLGHVRRLLDNVDGTGESDADEHVQRALKLTERALDREQ
jgi:hypothetical protein